MSATIAASSLMTAEQFLALPDDGMERMLIRGRLWEKSMTRRNRWHSSVEAFIAYLLNAWLAAQKDPRGLVVCGEAGFRLRRNPDTVVGIDVAYVSPELAASSSKDSTLIDGIPTLAVEILSPSDKWEEIVAKVNDYLAAGVPLVWVVDPHFRTVVVHQPGLEPAMFTGEDLLSGGEHLPGFEARTARFFAW